MGTAGTNSRAERRKNQLFGPTLSFRHEEAEPKREL